MLNVCKYIWLPWLASTLLSLLPSRRDEQHLIYSGVEIISAPRQLSQDGIDKGCFEKLLSLLSLDPAYRNLKLF
jgi:hypothetical protein